jgi:hypothetical protein
MSTAPNGSPVCLCCAVTLDGHGVIQVRADTVIRMLRDYATGFEIDTDPDRDHTIMCCLRNTANEIETVGEGLLVTQDGAR